MDPDISPDQLKDACESVVRKAFQHLASKVKREDVYRGKTYAEVLFKARMATLAALADRSMTALDHKVSQEITLALDLLERLIQEKGIDTTPEDKPIY